MIRTQSRAGGTGFPAVYSHRHVSGNRAVLLQCTERRRLDSTHEYGNNAPTVWVRYIFLR